MQSLVPFDQQGAFGPAVTLIYSSQYLNKKGISELANLLQAKYMDLALVKPKDKKAFCTFLLENQLTITPTQVIGTQFFKNMQKAEPSPLYHEKVLGFIVPRLMKTVQEHFPQAKSNNAEAQQVKEWAAGFLESCMTKELIDKQCNSQDSLSEEIWKERGTIGAKLCDQITANKLTENDLNLILEVDQTALKRLKDADNFATTLEFTGKYLALFSMSEDPKTLGEDVLCSLTTSFRQKMFPKDVTI